MSERIKYGLQSFTLRWLEHFLRQGNSSTNALETIVQCSSSTRWIVVLLAALETSSNFTNAQLHDRKKNKNLYFIYFWHLLFNYEDCAFWKLENFPAFESVHGHEGALKGKEFFLIISEARKFIFRNFHNVLEEKREIENFGKFGTRLMVVVKS